MPSVSAGEAIVQPTRQPVTEYVFDMALTMIVRSSMPGSVMAGTCSAPS